MTLLSYEGVEAPENFSDEAAIASYRAVALEKTVLQADFIAQKFPASEYMLEYCCGNGRLMIALSDRIEKVCGFDVAKSRVVFGDLWIKETRTGNAVIWQDDVLLPSTRLLELRADLGVCITGAFGYFAVFDEGADRRVIENLARNIESGGGLVLELYQRTEKVAACRRGGSRSQRHWFELPESDPFRFYLSEYDYDEIGRVLHHQKIFVRRDGRIDDGRKESLRLYDYDEVVKLLAPWFGDLSCYGSWAGERYTQGGETLIITARRSG